MLFKPLNEMTGMPPMSTSLAPREPVRKMRNLHVILNIRLDVWIDEDGAGRGAHVDQTDGASWQRLPTVRTGLKLLFSSSPLSA